MNIDSNLSRIVVSIFILFLIGSCSPTAAPSPFRPPAQPGPSQISITAIIQQEGFTTSPDVATLTPVPTPCINDLSFVQDLTIPDDTVVPPAGSIDKQWLVSNSGTCDWDSTYRLKLAGGDPLSAPLEQSLYPARAGTQATLRILFIAPQQAGVYQSVWQASASDGSAFGDSIYLQIVVE